MMLEGWRALDIDRPTRSPDLAFIAFDRDKVVGYAVADVFGDEGHQGSPPSSEPGGGAVSRLPSSALRSPLPPRWG